MKEKEYPCAQCKMRRKYDENPKSLIARFWHWHTRFCPGWKDYLGSLSEEERDETIRKYHLRVPMTIVIVMLSLSAYAQSSPKAIDRYGVCLLADGKTTGIRMDKPFAMHSIMKFPQAVFVADCLERQSIPLSETVTVRKDELMQNTWSPMLRMFDGQRDFSYAELLRLSLAESDNNACDILFSRFGGPKKVEEFLRQLGLADIHIQWTEQEMTTEPMRSADNNCTPKDLACLLDWLYHHREQNEFIHFVWETMAACQTGAERIASIIPAGAVFVHKTGTGFPSKDKRQDRNDAGVIIMPDGTYQVIAVFAPQSEKEEDVAKMGKKFVKR